MKKMLLVIDLQEGFRRPESESVVENILKLKGVFDKVVFSKFVNKKGSLFETQLGWVRFQNELDKKLFF